MVPVNGSLDGPSPVKGIRPRQFEQLADRLPTSSEVLVSSILLYTLHTHFIYIFGGTVIHPLYNTLYVIYMYIHHIHTPLYTPITLAAPTCSAFSLRLLAAHSCCAFLLRMRVSLRLLAAPSCCAISLRVCAAPACAWGCRCAFMRCLLAAPSRHAFSWRFLAVP